MIPYTKRTLDYLDPLDIFLHLPQQTSIAFLHSSAFIDYSSGKSILALFPIDVISESKLSQAYSKLDSHSSDPFENMYFCNIAYEVNHEIEKLKRADSGIIPIQNVLFIKYGLILIFDNESMTLTSYSTDDLFLDVLSDRQESKAKSFEFKNLECRFTRKEYLETVDKIRNYIIQGDVFEVNLTSKFWGELSDDIDGRMIFKDLIQRSPSQYSAYLKHDELEIISSSPERFLHVTGRHINSKPIKGTRKRSADPVEDEAIKVELQHSEKDLAENLMIVDLVRNDLGRIAKVGSVEVPELFKIESYQTVHQMVSTITCQLDQAFNYLDLLKAVFPPGSMTGAPKIRAMEIITEFEKIERGIYSGAIGMISPENYLDLSVVIRTIIKRGKVVEFQAGGAIVYDSSPQAEYDEMIDKLAAIEACLKTNIKKL